MECGKPIRERSWVEIFDRWGSLTCQRANCSARDLHRMGTGRQQKAERTTDVHGVMISAHYQPKRPDGWLLSSAASPATAACSAIVESSSCASAQKGS